MSKLLVAAWIHSIGIVATLSAGIVSGQAYPNKPIRIITSEAGGGNDLAARLISQGISGPLGQAIIIDNRGSRLVGPLGSKAPPDGYTLVAGASGFMLGPLLGEKSYDPIKDFAAITVATTQPNVLVVHPSLPVKSVKELIALATARPNDLNYASAETGSSAHISMELFNSMAKVKIMRINYKGNALALNDVVAGQVQMMSVTPGAVTSHMKAGRVRALAVSSAAPTILFPGLPTVAASLPGYESMAMLVVMAPAGTPAAIVNRLNQEMVRALNNPEVKDRLFNIGVEAGGTSPEETTALMKAHMDRTSKIIREAGIHAD